MQVLSPLFIHFVHIFHRENCTNYDTMLIFCLDANPFLMSTLSLRHVSHVTELNIVRIYVRAERERETYAFLLFYETITYKCSELSCPTYDSSISIT